jgi:hypothetical protein
MLSQVRGKRHRVLAMGAHAHGKRLDAAQHQETIEWTWDCPNGVL